MKKFIFAVLTLILVTGACQTEQKTIQKETSTNSPLQGTRWELTNINCTPIGTSPEKPFIIFNNDNSFSGNLGCNSFFGSYFANDKKINFEYNGSTKKLCSDMTLEKEFSKNLKSDISHYIIVNDILIIKIKDQEVLRFKATPQIEEAE